MKVSFQLALFISSMLVGLLPIGLAYLPTNLNQTVGIFYNLLLSVLVSQVSVNIRSRYILLAHWTVSSGMPAVEDSRGRREGVFPLFGCSVILVSRGVEASTKENIYYSVYSKTVLGIVREGFKKKNH